MKSFFVFVILFVEKCLGDTKKRPHIIFILADDLGWNDVGFHGNNEIFTPNIDALAYNGVILNRHYSETLCTPSRSALLTGKYPIHTGTYHNVLMETHPTGLPLSEKLLPQYLKSLGYKTHAVGKWHLGFYKKEYTPVYRGFDSFYGFWNGYQDYYKHNVQAWFVPFDGYDMRRNMETDWSALGKYSTDLFTDEAVNIIMEHNRSVPLFLYLAHLAPHSGTYEDPLQAPEEYIRKFSYLKDPNKRRYTAMVSKLDESVGNVIEALQKNDMLSNCIIVFVSDNGAPTTGLMRNYGTNWPLKGEKSTPWEGGIRTVALMWSKLLTRKMAISSQIMHLTDWLPTLYSAAGGNATELEGIDGRNMWEVLSGRKNEYNNVTILHNIDDDNNVGYAAIRHGSYKLVNGTSLLGYLDDWFGRPEERFIPSYDVAKISRSKTNKILTNSKELREKDVLKLRELVKISCKTKNELNLTLRNPCQPRIRPCLFNIDNDPCEKNNLYDDDSVKTIQLELEIKLQQFRKSKIKVTQTTTDKLSNPALYNNTWVNWADIKHSVIIA